MITVYYSYLELSLTYYVYVCHICPSWDSYIEFMPLGGSHVGLVTVLNVLHASTEFWLWLELMCGSKAASSFISFQKHFITEAIFPQISSFYFLLFSCNLGNGKAFFFKNIKCIPRKHCRKWCSHVILSWIFALTSFYNMTIIWPVVGGAVSLASELLVFLFCCLS